MHLLRILAVFLCAALVVHAGDAPRKLAFARDAKLYVANLDGTGAKKVADGAWPNISPDGTRLAFNTETEKTTERHIAIADVATGKITILPGIPSDNNCVPVWSPDGLKLIFNSMSDNKWLTGIINADGTGFHYFTPKAPITNSLNSIAWTPDSQDFYAQDLDTLYHYALDGSLKDKRSLANLIPRAGFSSGQQFTVSQDGHTLLMDTEMDESSARKNWDGPPPAVWTLDLASGKATRLTPKGLFAWMPSWVSESEFICAVQPEKSKQPSIYRLSADGKKRQLLVKDANNPTVSR